jgi:hypothetical protein
MTAFAGVVQKTLNYSGVSRLGDRLKLPSGRRYTSMTPEADLTIGARRTATVVQDELENTHQKRD